MIHSNLGAPLALRNLFVHASRSRREQMIIQEAVLQSKNPTSVIDDETFSQARSRSGLFYISIKEYIVIGSYVS
jgi:hypothetical protein